MTYEFGGIILVLAADLGFTLAVGVRIVPELRRANMGSLHLLSHLWLPSARALSLQRKNLAEVGLKSHYLTENLELAQS